MKSLIDVVRFVYCDYTITRKELNKAILAKDETKLKYYGAYEASLRHILQHASGNLTGDEQIQGTTMLRFEVLMSQE